MLGKCFRTTSSSTVYWISLSQPSDPQLNPTIRRPRPPGDPLLGLPCLSATALRCNADLQPFARGRPADPHLGMSCLNARCLSCNADLQVLVSRSRHCRLPGQYPLLVRTNCLTNSQPPGSDQLRYQGLFPSSFYCLLSLRRPWGHSATRLNPPKLPG